MRTLAPLAGGLKGPPIACSATQDRLDVFAAGPGNVPWRWSWNGAVWTAPAPLPAVGNGIPAEGLCAVRSVNDRVELFATGAGVNTPLWWRGNGTNWTAGPTLPAGRASLPPVPVAAVCAGPGNIDVFAAGASNTPWWWHWNGTRWTEPKQLNVGANLSAVRIAAVSSKAGAVDVFAAGAGSHLWHWKPLTGGGWSLHDRGGNLPNAGVSAVSWGPNRTDVFAASRQSGNLQHWWSDGVTFSGPETLGGNLVAGSVSAVSTGPDRLDVFGITSDKRLAHWQFDGRRWSGPDYHAENLPAGELSAVARSSRRFDVFAAGTGNTLQQWPGGGLERSTSRTWGNWPTNLQAATGNLRPDSLSELVNIVKEAKQLGKTVRAVGSSWSNSDVAVPKDYVVETDLLGSVVTGVLDRLLNPAGAAMNLVHVEAGIKLYNLNTLLDQRGCSLMTMGGSSGQSLAGALSTGVHGMDHEDKRSSLAQMVRAIHLVGPDGAQHWIEPSVAITQPGSVGYTLGIDQANLHYDDEWFNSVLVSVGSMGIVYSVVLEVDSQHDIREECERLTWTEMKSRLRGAGPDPFAGKRGVMVTINPYKVADGSRPCFLSTRTTVTPPTAPLPASDPFLAAYAGPQLLTTLKAARGTIPDVVTALTSQARPLKPSVGWANTVMGGPGLPPIRGLTVEIAFDATNTTYLDFIDAALQILHTQHYDSADRLGYLGWISLRFQGRSRAYLSPQSRSARTCTVEFAMVWRVPEAGVDWPDTPILLGLIEAEGRKHHGIQHWGMFGNLTQADVEAAYPQLNTWRKIRWALTKGGTVTTFDSDFTRRCGLSSPPAVKPPPVQPAEARQIWHKEQAAADSSAAWTDWNHLSHLGNQAKVIVLAAHPDGRMHAVMAGLDDQAWHNEQVGPGRSAGWTDWRELTRPGNKAKILTLAAHPDGRMHAALTGTDNQAYHTEQTSAGVGAAWTDWKPLTAPGNLAKFIALAAHPDGRMHAVLAGTDDQLYHTEQTSAGVSAAWTGWQVLTHPGNLAKYVALAAHPDGRMHAVLTGTDDQLYHTEQTSAGVNAAWTDWTVLSTAGNTAKAVALAAHPDGRMHAVITALDDQIWHKEQTGAGSAAPWTQWRELSFAGNKAKYITLAAHADGRMHAVMAGMDDQIWHNEQTAAGSSATWTDWRQLAPGNTAQYISLAGHPDGRMHAVMVGRG